ncbi:MAG: hypothetical protein V4787_13260 [Pseudomonadota bacterium]
MTTSSILRHSLRLGFVAALLAGTWANAQTNRSVRVAPAPAPAANSGAGAAAAKSFGMPNPSGLQSQFPGGLPSPSANPGGLPDPTIPNVSVPGVAAGSPVVDPGVAQGYPAAGGGGGGYVVGGVAGRTTAAPVQGGYTAMQIAGSFIGADANRDGDLTRAEAQRLTVAPYSFEEMDANHDDVLSRSEYENALR